MGKEEGNHDATPRHDGVEENKNRPAYSSPISQPSRPTALNIPAPAAHEPRSFKDEVQDMLTKDRPVKPQPDATLSVPERPQEATPPPTVCLKCGFKLSGLDVKMGQCFKCGAAVSADQGRDRPSRGPITIGI